MLHLSYTNLSLNYSLNTKFNIMDNIIIKALSQYSHQKHAVISL